MSRINCLQCKHYYSTWDKHLPRGCKIYTIKTLQMPSMAVKRETGTDCLAFEKKAHFDKENNKGDRTRDLNDPSLW